MKGATASSNDKNVSQSWVLCYLLRGHISCKVSLDQKDLKVTPANVLTDGFKKCFLISQEQAHPVDRGPSC